MKCCICGQVCQDNTSLETHLTDHEDYISCGERCLLCPKVITPGAAYREHLETHITTPFKCKICDETFQRKAQSKVHLHQHVARMPVKCAICLAYFCGLSRLKKHVAEKHCLNESNQEPNVQCPVCNAIFDEVDKLQSHITLSHSFDRLACDKCEEQFSSKEEMDQHKKQGDKFTCKLCKLSLCSQAQYVEHCLTHTGKQIKPVTGATSTSMSYQCYICVVRFNSLSLLENHMRMEHGDTGKCKICGNISENIGCLINHIEKVHGVEIQIKKKQIDFHDATTFDEGTPDLQLLPSDDKQVIQSGENNPEVQAISELAALDPNDLQDVVNAAMNRISKQQVKGMSSKVPEELTIQKEQYKRKSRVIQVSSWHLDKAPILLNQNGTKGALKKSIDLTTTESTGDSGSESPQLVSLDPPNKQKRRISSSSVTVGQQKTVGKGEVNPDSGKRDTTGKIGSLKDTPNDPPNKQRKKDPSSNVTIGQQKTLGKGEVKPDSRTQVTTGKTGSLKDTPNNKKKKDPSSNVAVGQQKTLGKGEVKSDSRTQVTTGKIGSLKDTPEPVGENTKQPGRTIKFNLQTNGKGLTESCLPPDLPENVGKTILSMVKNNALKNVTILPNKTVGNGKATAQAVNSDKVTNTQSVVKKKESTSTYNSISTNIIMPKEAVSPVSKRSQSKQIPGEASQPEQIKQKIAEDSLRSINKSDKLRKISREAIPINLSAKKSVENSTAKTGSMSSRKPQDGGSTKITSDSKKTTEQPSPKPNITSKQSESKEIVVTSPKVSQPGSPRKSLVPSKTPKSKETLPASATRSTGSVELKNHVIQKRNTREACQSISGDTQSGSRTGQDQKKISDSQISKRPQTHGKRSHQMAFAKESPKNGPGAENPKTMDKVALQNQQRTREEAKEDGNMLSSNMNKGEMPSQVKTKLDKQVSMPNIKVGQPKRKSNNAVLPKPHRTFASEQRSMVSIRRSSEIIGTITVESDEDNAPVEHISPKRKKIADDKSEPPRKKRKSNHSQKNRAAGTASVEACNVMISPIKTKIALLSPDNRTRIMKECFKSPKQNPQKRLPKADEPIVIDSTSPGIESGNVICSETKATSRKTNKQNGLKPAVSPSVIVSDSKQNAIGTGSPSRRRKSVLTEKSVTPKNNPISVTDEDDNKFCKFIVFKVDDKKDGPTPYICLHCPVRCNTPYHLATHASHLHNMKIQVRSNKAKPTNDSSKGQVLCACKFCPAAFPTFDEILKHYGTNHPKMYSNMFHKKGAFKCRICAELFVHLDTLKTHMNSVHKMPYNDKSRAQSTRSDANDLVYCCKSCNFNSASVVIVQQHNLTCHPEEHSNNFTVKSGRVKRREIIQQALEANANKQKSGAQETPKVRKSSNTYGASPGSANGLRYKCQSCDFSSRTVIEITNHNKTQHPGNHDYNFTVECEGDKPTTTSPSTTVSKSASSAGQMSKNHVCGLCGAKYFNAWALEKHSRTEHPSEDGISFVVPPKPKTPVIHTCVVCRLVFSKAESLYFHYREHHPNKGLIDDDVFVCRGCKMAFLDPLEMQTHLMESHRRGVAQPLYKAQDTPSPQPTTKKRPSSRTKTLSSVSVQNMFDELAYRGALTECGCGMLFSEYLTYQLHRCIDIDQDIMQ